jgi:imidazolonepropionase-like amidohydrolase/Tol biopolymer transport system component
MRAPIPLALLLCLATPATAADPAAPEAPAWDVSAPPGPSRQVPIDVRTGTWMSVDVHPDGQRLVFDLLGDLYELPLAGGEAKPLTRGMAWDMQPRYAPDGRSLAFTSDRGGGDNLWLLPLDGGAPTAVTEEDFRLLNSPAWTPDGRYVLGRKHFSSTRSLGAGEIWLYDRAGGAGLPLTDRTSPQKDLGEPAVSPDGRFVYFSLDATPGANFEYDKDSNGPIYAIDRLDRLDGRVERVAGGPGGAVRPTPHPDGRHLAYVRRIRDRSVLMLLDLRSGAERRLWDGLDRDHQETWAIHGLYPAMDWTPDGRSLVLWAQGRLWRLDVGDPAGAAEVRPVEIPFHVADQREIRDAVRFPVAVAPERFPVKAIRWPTVSPDGTRVVFEALGRLWIRELSGGEARPLTRQTGQLELFPSWSRDGKEIVYVSWDDAELGSIRVVPAKGGEGRALTREPGHWFEPVFTPDGAGVVARKGSGGDLTSARWSADPGLYLLDRKTGAAERISREGRSPHFGADGTRLFFLAEEAPTEPGGSDSLSLRSVGLVDREVRTHAHGAMATDLRVSPDGRWLAVQEAWNAWLTAFVPTGRTVEVSADGDALPRVKLSADAGNHLHFAGDAVCWSTGPTLFSAPVAEALAPRAEGEEPAPWPGTPLGFEQPLARPAGTAALVGGRVVTLKGDEVIEDGVVVWAEDRIVAVGPRGQVAVPTGAQVIDVSGKTVIPGLIDVHAHARQAEDGVVPEQNHLDLAMLAFGVTTMHDPSNDTETVFAASERQKAGTLLAPRLFSTGTILYGARARGYLAQIDSQADAAAHLRRQAAYGAFSVKSYNQPRREQRQQVLAAARELGMMVVPEGGALLMHNLTQIVDGHTGVEHALPVATAYDDVLQLWSATQVGYTPTLGVAYGGLGGENYWYAHTDVWADERLLSFVPRWEIDARARRRPIAPEEEYNHVDVAAFAHRLVEAGGHVQLGAHGQREGLAAHWELWMLAQGGFTPLQALRAGTLDGARYLGLDQDLGSIEVGKLADLAVIDGDPLTDLRQSREVALTVLGGRVYDAATLNPVWPAGPPRPPLWWEGEGTALPPVPPTVHRCGCDLSP